MTLDAGGSAGVGTLKQHTFTLPNDVVPNTVNVTVAVYTYVVIASQLLCNYYMEGTTNITPIFGFDPSVALIQESRWFIDASAGGSNPRTTRLFRTNISHDVSAGHGVAVLHLTHWC